MAERGDSSDGDRERGNGKMECECGSYDTYYGQFEGKGIEFLQNPLLRCPSERPCICMECTHQIIRSCTMTTHSTHCVPLCSEGPQLAVWGVRRWSTTLVDSVGVVSTRWESNRAGSVVGSLVEESVAMATTGAVVPGSMEYEVQYLLQYNNTHTLAMNNGCARIPDRTTM